MHGSQKNPPFLVILGHKDHFFAVFGKNGENDKKKRFEHYFPNFLNPNFI